MDPFFLCEPPPRRRARQRSIQRITKFPVLPASASTPLSLLPSLAHPSFGFQSRATSDPSYLSPFSFTDAIILPRDNELYLWGKEWREGWQTVGEKHEGRLARQKVPRKITHTSRVPQLWLIAFLRLSSRIAYPSPPHSFLTLGGVTAEFFGRQIRKKHLSLKISWMVPGLHQQNRKRSSISTMAPDYAILCSCSLQLRILSKDQLSFLSLELNNVRVRHE